MATYRTWKNPLRWAALRCGSLRWGPFTLGSFIELPFALDSLGPLRSPCLGLPTEISSSLRRGALPLHHRCRCQKLIPLALSIVESLYDSTKITKLPSLKVALKCRPASDCLVYFRYRTDTCHLTFTQFSYLKKSERLIERWFRMWAGRHSGSSDENARIPGCWTSPRYTHIRGKCGKEIKSLAL